MTIPALVLTAFIILYTREGHKYPAFADVAYGLIIIYALFIIMNAIFYVKRIDAKIGAFSVVFLFFILFTIHTAITVPLDFNRDIKNFADVYKEPAPIVVISSRKVDEGSKTRVTIWYLRKRSTQYNTYEKFLEAS